MRFNYSEDEAYSNQQALWRANMERALRGRKGQRALRDMHDALLAMPEKRLGYGHVSADGEVCAVGALVAHRRCRDGRDREAVLAALAAEAGPSCQRRYDNGGLPGFCWHRPADHIDGRCIAIRRNLTTDPPTEKPCGCTGYLADDDDEDGVDTVEFGVAEGIPEMVAWRLVELNDIELDHVTPERRYERVLSWVESALAGEVAA